jgi:signal peptidase II
LALAVAGVVVIVDQVTKAIALAHVSMRPTHVVGPFGLSLTYNTGSAFSLFQGASGALVLLDVVLITVLVIIGVRSSQRGVQVGVGLMLGGALGNLADRLVRGSRGVVDFITLSHWPTFNAADAAITIGAIVVAATLLVDMRRTGRTEESP